MLVDCRSDIDFVTYNKGTLTTGGLIGKINSNVTVKPVLEKCVFTGSFLGWGSRIGGLVGLSEVDITFMNCMFDPEQADYQGHATFVNLANGAKATFEDCYCTRYLETQQGVCVFNKVNLPEGCTYEMVDESFAQFDGKPYWKSGNRIKLTVPEGTKFDHWTANRDKGVFISDPWRKDGEHVLQDVSGPIFLYISEKSIPAGKEYTEQGVKYRYLTKSDYHYYVSDEVRMAKRWVFHSDDDLVFYDGNGDAAHITAVVGYDKNAFPSDGVPIINDIAEFITSGRKHTRLGIIAPRAFAGCSELQTIYFKDTNSSFYDALVGFDFMIDEAAFKGCPNLRELKMIQYTTKNLDHWEVLKPSQVFSIAADAFDDSPKCKISCFPAEYQNFLSSETWAPFQSRIMVYEATATDFHAEGTAYHVYRSTESADGLTSADKDKMMDTYLRFWNADYKNFNAADLLKTNDDARVYYVNVSGVESVSSEGVMRIYNDPGEYYNYKTIALLRNAIAGNTDVKAIEFYQTNGRSDNSHSDLKMVIQNGALEGCKNLKELRMFYYVEDGTDHWETLGPQDVIPGNNIFGKASPEELAKMSEEEMKADYAKVPKGFQVLVSTDRYQEFINDPNWVCYLPYIKAVEFDPTNTRKDYNENGLNYSYMTNPGGILQTSQVVSQDVSWWTAPRIAIEVALLAANIGTSLNAAGGILEKAATLETLESTFATAESLDMGSDQFTMFLLSYSSSPFGRTYPLFTEFGWDYGPDITGLISNGVLLPAEQLAGKRLGFGIHNVFHSQLIHWIYKETAALASLKIKAGIFAVLQQIGMSSSAFLASKCWGGSGTYNGDAL